MSRRALLLGVVLLVAAVAGSAAVSSVAAQSETTTAANATDDDNDSRQVVAQIDDNIVVTNYRYNASTETFYVTLQNRGDKDVSVTISETIDREKAGSQTVGIEVVEVGGGETVEASVDAQRVDGAAGVLILTDAAVENGNVEYLQESQETYHRLIKGDPNGGHVRSAAGFTGFGTLLWVLLGAWQYVATANSEEVEPSLNPNITLFGRIWRWRR
jgi:hypothetical protein